MKKYGVIGIDLQRLKGEFGTRALKLSGNNFGNMLFTKAVYNHIPNCFHLGFDFDPAKARSEYDGLVIPAANWINVKQDWGFLADLLNEADIPVCVVGLGSQISGDEDLEFIPEGTRKFLAVISRLSERVGVRGDYTRTIVKKLGVDNCVSLGCPSIFLKNSVPSVRAIPSSGDLRVGVGPTRYSLPKVEQGDSSDKQKELYRYAFRASSSIYYQSEQFEIACMNREVVNEEVESALAYYGADSEEQLIHAIMTKGRYHKDVDHWVVDSRRDDVYIGTRIHGAVSAILAGTPAVLLTHDARTTELSASMGIPALALDNFSVEYLCKPREFFNEFSYGGIQDLLGDRIGEFRTFYGDNGFYSRL